MVLSNPNYDPTELLRRAAKIGITPSDYYRLRVLLARGCDPKLYAQLAHHLAYMELCNDLNPIPFLNPTQMTGDVILGKNQDGTANRFDSQNTTSHMLTIGSTGVGKTVLMVSLLLQFMFLAAGIWAFDFVKRELRGLKRLAEGIGYQVHICRYELLRINLLDPQETDATLFPNICAEFLTLVLGLPPVAKLILTICITRLFERFGLFINPKAQPPLLSELIDEVRGFDGNSSAKEAIIIRLQALLANKRHIFNVRRGIPIAHLARKFIVWEFDGVESIYQNLVVSYLIAILFLQRVQTKARDLTIVALDEAGGIYSKKAEQANDGPSYITKMTCTVRKMMIGILAFTQTTWDLSNAIIANSGIKVLFRVGSAQDYDVMASAMGLDSRQKQFAKTELPIGSQIIKMGFGWQKPFINHSPFIRLPEDVSDEEVRESVKPLLDMIPQPQVPVLSLPEFVPQTANACPRETLPADEEILLHQIKTNPDITSATEHYQMCGLSTKRGTAAKQSLVSKNLIKETLLESGRRGRAEIFLEPLGDDTGRLGSRVHRHMRQKAGDWYQRQNCITEPEKNFSLDGRQVFVDLAVTWPNGKTEAVEVETQDSERALENIRKNLAIGFQTISVLTPNKKVRDAIKRRADSELTITDLRRIKFPAMSFYDKDLN